MPNPVAALTQAVSVRFAAMVITAEGSAVASTLFQTVIIGMSSASISLRT